MIEGIGSNTNKEELEPEIQRQLQLPLFWGERMKKFIQKIATKLWQMFHYPIGQKMSVITFISILAIIASMVFGITMLKWKTGNEAITSEKITFTGLLLAAVSVKEQFVYW